MTPHADPGICLVIGLLVSALVLVPLSNIWERKVNAWFSKKRHATSNPVPRATSKPGEPGS